MARVPLIGEERGDLTAFISRVKSERGRLINLYRVLLNSPPVAESWLDFNSAVRFKTTLEPALREMIILRVCVLNGAEYQAVCPSTTMAASPLSVWLTIDSRLGATA